AHQEGHQGREEGEGREGDRREGADGPHELIARSARPSASWIDRRVPVLLRSRGERERALFWGRGSSRDRQADSLPGSREPDSPSREAPPPSPLGGLRLLSLRTIEVDGASEEDVRALADGLRESR